MQAITLRCVAEHAGGMLRDGDVTDRIPALQVSTGQLTCICKGECGCWACLADEAQHNGCSHAVATSNAIHRLNLHGDCPQTSPGWPL